METAFGRTPRAASQAARERAHGASRVFRGLRLPGFIDSRKSKARRIPLPRHQKNLKEVFPIIHPGGGGVLVCESAPRSAAGAVRK
jgi:hypothetical protein